MRKKFARILQAMSKSDFKFSRLQTDDKRSSKIAALASLPPHLRQHPALPGAPLPRNNGSDVRAMSMQIGIVLAAEFIGIHQPIILALYPHLLFQSPHETLDTGVKFLHLVARWHNPQIDRREI